MSAPTPTRSFYGLRHGATDWNREGRFQGRTDNPLNEDGLGQAHAAADVLRGIRISRIVSSPLVRALKTAEIIGAAVAVPVEVDPGIIEFDFGSFEGLPVRDMMAKHGVKSAESRVHPALRRRDLEHHDRTVAALRFRLARPSRRRQAPVCLP
ncbi:histidine phosphatase family protein [Bradyrhizobium sp. AS23.2]|uniref:histidine phosphatase family protein n=1 Tax=Bradyrhizobium sp. AS23.2 TaxID=1680155 RepID=UPI001FDA0AB7|nr:histidine phosphatase family protein [Bradyrhizobium sp. AS23.2]